MKTRLRQRQFEPDELYINKWHLLRLLFGASLKVGRLIINPSYQGKGER